MNTQDYRDAPSGQGPLASQWLDKPHRLIYDLCNEVERLQNLLKPNWKVVHRTANYVYWTYTNNNGKAVYNVTPIIDVPPQTDGGYHNLDALIRLKNDESKFHGD